MEVVADAGRGPHAAPAAAPASPPRQHVLLAVSAVAVVSGVRWCPWGFAVRSPEAGTVEHLLVFSGPCMSFVENGLVRSLAHLHM